MSVKVNLFGSNSCHVLILIGMVVRTSIEQEENIC